MRRGSRGQLAADAGIAVSSISRCTPRSGTSAIPRRAPRQAVDYVAPVGPRRRDGSRTIIVAPSAVLKTRRLAPAEDEWGWAIEASARRGVRASVGVDVSLEPGTATSSTLNRLDQAIELWRATGLENGGVMGDTFHMNIEEA